MDNRMLVLWATPRSTSTAFEWMMRQRGDFRCLHEPFGVPYYRGADRRTTRFDENPQDMSVTYDGTWREIGADGSTRSVTPGRQCIVHPWFLCLEWIDAAGGRKVRFFPGDTASADARRRARARLRLSGPR